MTVPLRTRADLKAAGRAMATEAVAALAAHLATLTVEQLEDGAQMDRLGTMMLDAMERTAESYRALGIPALWVQKFRTTFARTASDQCRAHGFRMLPVAGNA